MFNKGDNVTIIRLEAYLEIAHPDRVDGCLLNIKPNMDGVIISRVADTSVVMVKILNMDGNDDGLTLPYMETNLILKEDRKIKFILSLIK